MVTTAAGADAAGGEPRRTAMQRAVHYVVHRLRWRLGLRIYGIYARTLRVSDAPAPVLPGFAWRRFEAGDVEALLSCRQRVAAELDEAFVRTALAKGDACDAILHDGEIVSFLWQAFTPTHDSEGVYVDFPRGTRYGYHAYTLPEFRGRHWARLIAAERDRYAVARGAARGIAYIRVDNLSSIRSALAAGSRRVGFAGYLRSGRFFVPFRSPGVRRLGVRFFQPGAPPG